MGHFSLSSHWRDRPRNPRPVPAQLVLTLTACLTVLALPACSTAELAGSQDNVPDGTDSYSDPSDNQDNLDIPDGGPAGPENYDWDSVAAPELAEDVVNLDEEECFDRLEVSEDFSDTTIHLFCPPSSVDIEVGDLLVSSEGGGYLLRILAAADGDYRIIAETTPGTMTELFPNGGFFGTFPLDGLSRSPLNWGTTTLYQENGLTLRFDGATIDMNQPELHFGTEHFAGEVLRRDLYLQMDSSISLSVSASATESVSHSLSHDLFSRSFPISLVTPTFTYVGEVILTARLKVSASMGVGATLRTGTTMDSTLRVGTTYNAFEDRFEDLENIETEFTAHDVELTTQRNMSLKASIDFRAEVKHYKILSTYLEMGPYLKFTAEAECSDLDWALKAGWGGRFGAHADLYFWNVNIVTIPWDEPFGGPIAEGTKELPISVGGDDCEEPASCQVVQELSCGQTITGNTGTDAQATNILDGYEINVGNYAAPELVYRWNGGPAEFSFVDPRPTEVNHDIILLDASGDGSNCTESESLAHGHNSLLWEEGRSALIVIDGYYENAGAFELQVDCDL